MPYIIFEISRTLITENMASAGIASLATDRSDRFIALLFDKWLSQRNTETCHWVSALTSPRCMYSWVAGREESWD